MKLIVLITFFVFFQQVLANDLTEAYQKEYAYLVAEKEALEDRLQSLKQTQMANLALLQNEIDALEVEYFNRQNRVDQLNRNLAEANRNQDFSANDQLLLETTVVQALESIKKQDVIVDETQSLILQLTDAVIAANNVLNKDSIVETRMGEFFAADGERQQGNIYSVGRIASYAYNGSSGGSLAPAGNGELKVWSADTLDTAQQVSANTVNTNIDVFLYEDVTANIDQKAEKTLSDEVEAGGLIAKIIIALGLIGFVFVLVRIVFLKLSSTNITKLTNKINDKMSSGDRKAALELCKTNKNSASNVIAAALRNLEKDRDHIEDIVSESIMHESSRIDLFGSLIIVIAAVSPLLGLLGTVTGMIGTFDIITEFGTGDPKLLSSGISEALITTKFGLNFAIPLLLLGNLLGSWGTRIKNDIEQSALHIINAYK